jgi:hypothetical protein
MTPVIVVVGNCQASFVANFLKALPEIGQHYEIRRFRNFTDDLDDNAAGEPPGDLPTFITNNKPRIAAFLRQTTHNWVGDPITRGDFAPHTAVVDYPVALNSYLWPLVCRDDRFAAMPAALRRRFPYSLHDSLLRKLALDGVPEAEVVDAYMAHDVTAMFRLDRLKTLHDAKARQIDARASFPIGDYIDANMGRAALFRTMNHPTGAFMAEIMRRILAHLPFATDHAAASYRLGLAAAGPGIQGFDAAIDPRIVRHFGLTWAAGDRYRFWEEGLYSFAEYLVRLHRMQCCLKAPEALRLQRGGDAQGALRLMEEVVAEVPRSAHYRVRLAELHAQLKAPDRALAMLREAWALEPSLETGVKLAQAQMRCAKQREAEATVAELGLRFDADSADIAIMQANFQLTAGNKQGAVDRLRSAVGTAARHDHRLWLALAAALQRTRDIEAARDAMSEAYTLSGMAPTIGTKLDALRDLVAGRQQGQG